MSAFLKKILEAIFFAGVAFLLLLMAPRANSIFNTAASWLTDSTAWFIAIAFVCAIFALAAIFYGIDDFANYLEEKFRSRFPQDRG